MLVAACTSWPGKSWRRPKWRPLCQGRIRHARSCVVSHGRPRNISDDDATATTATGFPLDDFFHSPLSSSPPPSPPVRSSSLSPSPYEILVKNLRRDKLLFARRKSAKKTRARVWNKRKLDYARIWFRGDVTELSRDLLRRSYRSALFSTIEGKILRRSGDLCEQQNVKNEIFKISEGSMHLLMAEWLIFT